MNWFKRWMKTTINILKQHMNKYTSSMNKFIHKCILEKKLQVSEYIKRNRNAWTTIGSNKQSLKLKKKYLNKTIHRLQSKKINKWRNQQTVFKSLITLRFVPWYTSQVCSSCTASLNRRSTKQNIISFLVYSLILFFSFYMYFLICFSYSFNYWVIWFFLDWLIHSFVYSLCFFTRNLILIYLYFLIHIFFIALFNQQQIQNIFCERKTKNQKHE